MLIQLNIISRLNLTNFVISIIYFYVLFFIIPKFCFAETLLSNIIDHDIHKIYNVFFLKKQNYNFSIEIYKKILTSNYRLEGQVCLQSYYHLNNDKFLFVRYFGVKEHYHSLSFKNVFFIGSGYNILRGPVFFAQMQYSPAFYYIIYNNYQNNYFKSLMYSSGTYSYQLINNIYYCQYLGALANFRHICTKLENSLNIFFNNQTILLKCSYNVVLNENKFHNVLPNVNRYFSVSCTYFL